MTNNYAVALANKQIEDLVATMRIVQMPNGWECAIDDVIYRLLLVQEKLVSMEMSVDSSK